MRERELKVPVRPRVRVDLLYFSMRSMLLFLTIASSFVWAMYGFDSTLDELANQDWAGMGYHWSTIQATILMAYLLLINFQVGGLTSLGQLRDEIFKDFRAMFAFSSRSRETYASRGEVHFFRALIPVLFIPVFANFVFEVPYVFLLNQLQYNDWFYPIYAYEPNGLGACACFYRNMILFLFPLPVAMWLMVTQARHRFTFRVDKWFLLLSTLALVSWALWIYTPSSLPVQTVQTLHLPVNETWTLPKQGLFPQNTYVYVKGPPNIYYTRDELNGWHQYDPVTHLLNIATKYLVFAAVTYACMFKIKPKSSEEAS